MGQEISTLVNGEQPAGTYEVEFSLDNKLTSGTGSSKSASGIYLYRVIAGSLSSTQKMIFLK